MASERQPLQKAGWENQPLPVGGARVPAGMEDHANWRDLPEQAPEVVRGEDISAEYVAAENKRNAYGELKKTLALVTPAVASIFKNQVTKEKTTDEAKKAQIDTLIAQESRRRDEIVEKLRAFQEQDGLKPDENEFGASLAKIVSTVPSTECMDQMTHVKWNDETKKLSQQIFRQQAKFLEIMKAEKKKKKAQEAAQ